MQSVLLIEKHTLPQKHENRKISNRIEQQDSVDAKFTTIVMSKVVA